MKITEKQSIVIKFAGDSGDGMQVTGGLFTSGSAITGNDIATFPDFPAEIRAPLGTVAGVSGFQIRFGSAPVHSAGDACDVLVAMNAAALKSNIENLKPQGILIVNSSGFDNRNLRLAGYNPMDQPLKDAEARGFMLIDVDLSKVAKKTLESYGLGSKEMERGKNMVALGMLSWMFSRPLDTILALAESKFRSKGDWKKWNKELIQAGWNLGDTMELFHERYEVRPASLPPGTYRGISGNEALALGLLCAAQKAGLKLFLGAYPITPASDILHELVKHKDKGVDTFMAEDEIAAICAAIGASYGGALGVTASSGPGIALKTEAMGLAVTLELPLVICNVQRGGPSTGLPTKTEQSDLLQAVWGRNGEAPMVVLAASSPKDCFNMAYKAVKIALEHTTPVLLLSDGYIANGAEPWKFPTFNELPEIIPRLIQPHTALEQTEPYLPYKRNNDFSRTHAVPGTPGMQHRIGGLEKQVETGHVSYDPQNHEKMVRLRQSKVEAVAETLPAVKPLLGPTQGALLILGWGSTLGAITEAVEKAQLAGMDVTQAHLKYIHPFPPHFFEFLKGFKIILIPEMNSGQLTALIKAKAPHKLNLHVLSKVQGKPFYATEIFNTIQEMYHGNTEA